MSAALPRRRKSRGYKTLASLLDAQPKGLVKDSRHRLLWDHFIASERLQKLRISSRCYRLLNEATIKPDNLSDFYRTYRLPSDPFFPLFLAVKSEWIEERERWREQRDKEIFDRMKALPDYHRRALRILAEYERIHHPAGDNPLWENRLFPRTKKRAEEMMRFDENQWYEEWRRHLTELSHRYRDIPPLMDRDGRPSYSSRVLAVMVLRCREVNKKEIMRNFRGLSKKYHPDYGGQAEAFHRIKKARDMLLNGETE